MTKNNAGPERYRKILAVLGILVVIWGVLGITQISRRADGGFDMDAGGTVARVEPDGPADRAGLEQGDLIAGVGETAESGLWKKPVPVNARIGETKILHVERGGETTTFSVVWEPASRDAKLSEALEFLVTLAFLGFGLWAFFVSGNRAGMLLALFGLAYGATNFHAPGTGPAYGAVAWVQSLLSLFYTALLAHFLMAFPEPKWFVRGRTSVCLLYFPFAVYLVSSVIAGFVYPAFRSGYVLIMTVTDSFYMVLALAALVHGGIRLKRRGIRGSGFFWIPAGLGVAIGPFVIVALIQLAAPGFAPPGEAFMQLFGFAIPAGLALAVVMNARRSGYSVGKQL